MATSRVPLGFPTWARAVGRLASWSLVWVGAGLVLSVVSDLEASLRFAKSLAQQVIDRRADSQKGRSQS